MSFGPQVLPSSPRSAVLTPNSCTPKLSICRAGGSKTSNARRAPSSLAPPERVLRIGDFPALPLTRSFRPSQTLNTRLKTSGERRGVGSRLLS